MPTNHDAAWLDKLHEAFTEALRANNLEALGACFSTTAVLLPPARAIVAGREAIVEFWKGAERIQDLIFETTDSAAMGDGALREAGNLLLTMRAQGRDTFNNAAKYVATWVKADGGWKIDSLAWNAAGRPGGRRGAGGGGGRGGAGRQGGGGGGGGGQGAGGQGAGRGRQGGGGRQGAGGGAGGGGGGRQGGGGRGRQGGGNAQT